MSSEKSDWMRLQLAGVIPATEHYSPSKAKESFYSQRLKEWLKEEIKTDVAGNAVPPEAQSDQPSYQSLLDGVLEAIKRQDQDQEMLLRADLKNTFRVSDEQIGAALLRRHSQAKVQRVEASHDSVSLADVEALRYLMDGWIPEGDLCLTYGPYGTGKTTLALWKAHCYAKGINVLDRSTPCTPGKTLFIATDSGASPLKKAFKDLGLDPDSDPLLQPGHPDQMIWIWAYEPNQGHDAWIADIHGIIALEQMIERRGISYIVIDSAKSVSSAAGWSYTSNESVKALLKHLREGVCQPTGACIEFLSHDGSEKGSHSGAKAWAEDPSMVCSLTLEEAQEGRPAGVTVTFKKDRAAVIDPRRKLTYGLSDGALELRADVEVVGTCEEAILAVMWAAHQRGVGAMRTGELADEVWARHKKPRKTVENTLARISGSGKGPKPTPLIRPQRGVVALSPREIQRRSSSSNRGVGEMGGGKSRSLAAQGIYSPPFESPTGETQPPTGESVGDAYSPCHNRDLRVSPPSEGGAPLELRPGDLVQVRDAWRNWSNGHQVLAAIDGEGLVKVRSSSGRVQHVKARNIRHCEAA